MSFDLTNKNIQDTFQNLLQKTGSDNRLYDLEGNEVTNLRINGTLTADQYVVSSSVTNVTTLAQSGSTQFGDSSDDSHTFQGNITSSGNISASGYISASNFVGDGSGLTGLTSAAISSYTNNGNNRVVTSVNGSTVNSEANLTFDGTALNINGELTSSKILVNAPNSTDDFFLLKSGSLDVLKVNGEGVLQLGSFSFTPTAVKGGLYYDNGDDEF